MVHIIKLCVGVGSIEELEAWRAERVRLGQARADGMHMHRTRMMPRRAGEIAGQGSLYWVIAGAVRCRQPIAELRAATDREGRACCEIIMEPRLVRTVPYPRRPFQGWRYLADTDAPADLGTAGEELPPEGMAEELAKYGLL